MPGFTSPDPDRQHENVLSVSEVSAQIKDTLQDAIFLDSCFMRFALTAEYNQMQSQGVDMTDPVTKQYVGICTGSHLEMMPLQPSASRYEALPEERDATMWATMHTCILDMKNATARCHIVASALQ